jgi:hypothetical protein
MGIGAAVVCFAAGAILYWAVDVDLPYVDDNTLGAILILAGALAAVVAVIMNTRRSETGTSVGTGIGVLATGAILYWAVDVDFPFVTDSALGVILMFAGVTTVAAAVGMHVHGSRDRSVDERRTAREPDPWAPREPDPWAPTGGPPPQRTPYDTREVGDFDPRYADPRYADPRYADPRYADPRYADPRYADPRYDDPRYDDPRYDAGYRDRRDYDHGYYDYR